MINRFSLTIIITAKILSYSTAGSATTDNRLLLSYTKTPQKAASFVPRKMTIALFDTSQTDRYCYDPMLQIAHANNFDIAYYPVSKILDTPLDGITFEKHDCAFFILCPEFLKTMNSSPVSQKILSFIQHFSKLPSKMTCLMFPPIKLEHQNPVQILSPLFTKLGITPSVPHEKNAMFQQLTNRFLQLPLEYRPIPYHTTLSPPRLNSPSFNVEQTLTGKATPLALLPMKQQHDAEELKKLFPLGIYWFNHTRNNHLIISSSSLLNFSGISENFKLCPMQFQTRKKVHNALNETIWEMYQVLADQHQYQDIAQGINTKKIIQSNKNPLPETIELLGNYQTISKKIKPNKIAWMEIGIFSPKHKNQKEQQKKLIKFTLNSNLDYLWISLNPNLYYSPIVNNLGSREEFLQTVELFTDDLADRAKKKKIAPPKILIGFEIANNLYGPRMPKQFAHDLYGNAYKDLPQPLDQAFWDNEVKTPLKLFLDDWKALKLADSIKIAGVVVDLEMYGRKTTGQFLPTMGFEPETIAKFLQPPLANRMKPEIFSQYLMDNKLFSSYFEFLEKQSKKLGKDLRDFFQKTIPNGVIACYAPNISIDWFYKGLYQGLSTTKQPMHLFTFNSEFRSHEKWLAKNNIQTYHSSVLMLSKVTSEKEFKLVDHVLKHHDGVWLNRFSRITESYHQDWSTLEQTPMTTEQRKQFSMYLANQHDNHEQPVIPNTDTSTSLPQLVTSKATNSWQNPFYLPAEIK
ncbi:hypothetical protein KKA53_02220 [Candidatus Dependentiae bacterium]|nr:hypothetical protein [Candidatus Dependentiae bacterium]